MGCGRDKGKGIHTRITNHPIPPPNTLNLFFTLSLTISPRYLVSLSHPCKLRVQLRALVVVLSRCLAPVGAEPVFVQWVDVDWGADAVDCAEICVGGVSM